MQNRACIQFKQVSFFTNDINIVHDISFTLNFGEIITLLGPNGAGKSTLIKLALGLLTPTKGTITRFEKINIGYVPQKIHIDPILPLTVAYFMHLTNHVSKQAIKEALEHVNGITLYQKPMQKLSGGELQRVLLAQALLDKPQLLVLDEPAQGIDINGQSMFYNLIEQIRNDLNCAVLMVSHDLHLVMAKTDQVLCINRHICCRGSPSAVTQHPEFNRMFDISTSLQLAIYTHNHDHSHDGHLPLANKE